VWPLQSPLLTLVFLSLQNLSSRLGDWQSGSQLSPSNGQNRIPSLVSVSEQKPALNRQPIRSELVTEVGSRGSWSPPSVAVGAVGHEQGLESTSRVTQGKVGANGYHGPLSAPSSVTSKSVFVSFIVGFDNYSTVHS